jgi:segregation and condensation protein A
MGMHVLEENGNYRIKLDVFEGPLDLLLFLIHRDRIDIFDIPIHHITDQYMEYLNFMKILDVDVAGEFLVMAATLMKIKSRMLLPHGVDEGEELEDPREKLVQQLLEYRKYKRIAQKFGEFEERESDYYYRSPHAHDISLRSREFPSGELIQVNIFELLHAYFRIVRKDWQIPTTIERESISIEERMESLLARLQYRKWTDFDRLFDRAMGEKDLIVTFLALLEMIRMLKVQVRQLIPMGIIKLRLRSRSTGSDRDERE